MILRPFRQELGVPFQTRDGCTLRFDAFLPAGGSSAPAVFCIHGGGWVGGDPSHMHPVAAPLAARGFAAFCMPYRLAPAVRHPVPVQDLFDGVASVLADPDRWGIDPERRASLGNSAGGHMAAMLGLAAPEHVRSRCVVDLCGVSDVRDRELLDHPVCQSFLPLLFGATIEEAPHLYEDASPVCHVRPAPPPFFLAHGLADSVVPPSQTRILADALQAAGGAVELHLLPVEDHAFTPLAWQRIENLFTDFLRRHLT